MEALHAHIQLQEASCAINNLPTVLVSCVPGRHMSHHLSVRTLYPITVLAPVSQCRLQ